MEQVDGPLGSYLFKDMFCYKSSQKGKEKERLRKIERNKGKEKDREVKRERESKSQKEIETKKNRDRQKGKDRDKEAKRENSPSCKMLPHKKKRKYLCTMSWYNIYFLGPLCGQQSLLVINPHYCNPKVT